MSIIEKTGLNVIIKNKKNNSGSISFDYKNLEQLNRILDVLKEEGYISDYKPSSKENNNKFLLVDLKYNNGIPVIKEISRVSKPGRRVYSKAESIPKIQNGLGIAIVSTSKGIMTDNDARIKKIGGEIICKVF